MDSSVYQAKRQRLAVLELRAARYGIDAPAEVIGEIMELKKELKRDIRHTIVTNTDKSNSDIMLICIALILSFTVLLLTVTLVLLVWGMWMNGQDPQGFLEVLFVLWS